MPRIPPYILRYVVPIGLILAVSVGAAGVDYIAVKNPRFSSACTFYVGIIPSEQVPGSPDAIKAHQQVVLGAVQAAKLGGAMGAAAKSEGVSPVLLNSETAFAPAPFATVGLVTAAILDKKKDRAVALVNAVCNQIVATIQKQRSDSVNNQISTVQSRLKTIQKELKSLLKIPPKKRSVVDIASIQTQKLALQANTILEAKLLTAPPDRIYVVTPAVVAKRYDPRSKTKFGLIGLAVGAFLSFLYVLVFEAIRDNRRRV